MEIFCIVHLSFAACRAQDFRRNDRLAGARRRRKEETRQGRHAEGIASYPGGAEGLRAFFGPRGQNAGDREKNR